MSGRILPEGYRYLPLWNVPVSEGEAVEARSVDAVLEANAAGVAAGNIYFTAPQKTEADLRRVLGKCRIVADSMEELHQISHAAQAAAGGLETVGIRLALDGWAGPGIGTDILHTLSRKIRKLPALSVRGCFVQGDSAGLYGAALGRYYRDCYEAAKRMSAILPCGIVFLCITGGGKAAWQSALEHPETVPEFRRAAEIVAAQNRSAFYARLFVT